MREDAEKMDENKKKDTLKRMSEMADLNAINFVIVDTDILSLSRIWFAKFWLVAFS